MVQVKLYGCMYNNVNRYIIITLTKFYSNWIKCFNIRLDALDLLKEKCKVFFLTHWNRKELGWHRNQKQLINVKSQDYKTSVSQKKASFKQNIRQQNEKYFTALPPDKGLVIIDYIKNERTETSSKQKIEEFCSTQCNR